MAATSTAVAADAVTPVGPDRFRAVLGRFPTGVVVVTGMAGGRPVGMTVGSFFSLSLEPPLVGFAVGRGSQTWPKLAASGAFCVNVLGEHQAEVASWFAKRGVDRFDHVDWAPSRRGTPGISGAIAWIDCDLHAMYPIGDHDLVVATVRGLEESEAPMGPLVFYHRTFGGFRHVS